jgi:hypothetical protein
MPISYNPGHQSVLKDLKQSTRQRFVAIDFDYPHAGKEAEIRALGAPVCCRRNTDRMAPGAATCFFRFHHVWRADA